MLHHSRCVAPALLAALFGVVAASVARAEPAPAAAANAADCLAKPNAPAAAGNHWYYHLDRPSGRHCWYQRPVTAAQNEAGQSRSAPARVEATAPVDQPAPAASADTPDDAGDRSPVPPVTAAPAPPPAWPAASPAPPSREETTALAIPSRAEPALEPAKAEPPPAPPIRLPVRGPNVERPPASAEEAAHMPAVLGAALALVIVILGSLAARLGARFARGSRRRKVPGAPASNAGPPIYRPEDSPSLVPVMPRESDITRETLARRASTDARVARRDQPASREGAAGPGGESARVLEENVRELLRRLRNDLQTKPRSSAAPPPTAQQLDDILAMWRGRRRKPAG